MRTSVLLGLLTAFLTVASAIEYSCLNVPAGQLPPPLQSGVLNSNIAQVGYGGSAIADSLLAATECLQITVFEEGFKVRLDDYNEVTRPGMEYDSQKGYYTPYLEKSHILIPDDLIDTEHGARGARVRKIKGGDCLMSHYAIEQGNVEEFKKYMYDQMGQLPEWNPVTVWNSTYHKLFKFSGPHLNTVPHYPLPGNQTIQVQEAHQCAFLDDWFESCSAYTGYPVTHNLNDYTTNKKVCGAEPSNIRPADGFRSVPQNEFGPTAEASPYVTVIRDATINRVLFQGTQAVGVEGRFCGLPFSVRFAPQIIPPVNHKCPRDRLLQIRNYKKVVLASGVYGNPQILLHSGVGPRQDLQNMGIPVVVDSPHVGQNLKEGSVAYIGFYTNFTAESVGIYDTNTDWIATRPAAFVELNGYKYLMLLTPSYFFDYTANVAYASAYALSFELTQEVSGYVKLSSANPDTGLLIYRGFNGSTMAKQQAGLTWFKNLLTTTGMIDRWQMYQYYPENQDTTDYTQAIKSGHESILHASGTTRMTISGITNGVVDARTYDVLGTSNLKAISMSNYPMFFGAGGQAPSFLMAFNFQNSVRRELGFPQL